MNLMEKINENIKRGIRSWLNVSQANPYVFNINEMMDFEGNAIRNRIWYRGDSNELEQFYEQNAEYADKYKFWSSKSTPGLEMRKIHTGLPALTVRTLAAVVLPDMGEFEFSSENEKQKQIWKDIAKPENNNFADKVEVMKSITNNDTALIDTLKEELNQVKDQKAEIEQKRQEVSDARSELEAKQKEVQGLVEESNAVIAEINASEKEANSLANQLKSEFNSRSDELAQAYKDYNAALSKEEQKKRQEAANKVVDVDDDNYNNDYNVPDNDNSGDGSGSQGSGTANGQFIWPAPGTTVITSGVGPRWGTNHNGIDISSGNAYGSPIVAADGGTVIVAVHSGWGGGYGLHVMIDHGNGYTTVYGHASSVLVNEGDKVSQGQTIAYIGSTGDSTGPHLHFEIRQNGSICDPEQYVSP